MSEAHAAGSHAGEHAGEHGHRNYVRIWAILLVLLAISVVGPMFEIRVVTLVTAFGIAIVKAYMVAKNFMHLDIEERYATYLLLTMLVFIFLFFAGTAPDVMKLDGNNWDKPETRAMIEAGLAEGAASGHH